MTQTTTTDKFKFHFMTKKDWLSRARDQHAKDVNGPIWREHWTYRFYVRGKLIFKGSFEACKIAVNGWRTEPYEIKDCTGRSHVSNR